MRAPAVALLVLAAAAVACGGDPIVRIPSKTTPAGPNQPAYEDDVSIDGVAYADMDRSQRAKYMADVVTPTMRTLFVAHDPATYKRAFGCATCHGTNATEVDFAMPNGLSPLDPNQMPSVHSDDARESEWTSFMVTQVVPRMAQLLGEAPSDDTGTGEGGFGCFDCHATK